MSLHIPGVNHSECYVDGLDAANAMTCPTIKSNDTVLAVIVVEPTASVAGGDVSDYTAGDGVITAATEDNTNLQLLVIHTNAPPA